MPPIEFKTDMTPHLRRLRQSGFTLIELMIAMLIGIFIVLALVTLLTNVNRNNQEMNKSSAIMENGRFSLQMVDADVSHAGFWAGYIPAFDDLSATAIPGDVPTAVPDPCKTFSTWTAQDQTNMVGISVQGYEIPATVPSPTLSVCSSIVVSPKASTDVLVVRHADTCVPGDTESPECQALAVGKLYFQTNRCTTNTATFTLSAATSTSTSTLALSYPGRKRSCGSSDMEELRRFTSTLYYVRNYAVTAGDGIPTLMRSEFDLSGGTLQHKTAEALIEGVEGFRVEYGVDNLSRSGAPVDYSTALDWADSAKITPSNRGDGVPDGSYVRCTTATPCTVAQLMNVVAVKVYVLVRSSDSATSAGYRDTKTYNLGSTTLGPFNDGYKRHVFSQTVRLMNVAARRETP